MLFDYMKTGRIYSEDLGAVIRSVGLKPSEAQIKAIQRDLKKGRKFVLSSISGHNNLCYLYILGE